MKLLINRSLLIISSDNQIIKAACEMLDHPLKHPKHVAIIMDGNGRWAESKGKKRVLGHKHGVKSLRKTIAFACEKKIEVLTIFAFSSENWQRPKQEVNMLMELFLTVLNSEAKKLLKNNIRLKVIGDITGFNDRLQKKVFEAEKLTADCTGLVLNVAANFGGRWDIIETTKKLAALAVAGEIAVEEINEKLMNQVMPLNQVPAVDLMIRTGGEHRISNFLLWQLAYAELYFSDVLWPDFDGQSFQLALDVFAGTERRFGKTSDQLSNPTK